VKIWGDLKPEHQKNRNGKVETGGQGDLLSINKKKDKKTMGGERKRCFSKSRTYRKKTGTLYIRKKEWGIKNPAPLGEKLEEPKRDRENCYPTIY